MKNVFVHTVNVKNFISVMKEAGKINSEPVFLTMHGQAGRGKTSTARYYAAQEGWTYCRALKGWSELWMLQDLCFELQIDPVPRRKKPAFEAIKMKLYQEPRPVLIDEADKLNEVLLEWIRDLADLTFVPFVLIGEKLIVHKMKKERRRWSRTVRAMEFGPIQTKDILFFAKQASELSLEVKQAEMLKEASNGDFRLVKRDMRTLEELVQVNERKKITDDMVKLAIKKGFRGE